MYTLEVVYSHTITTFFFMNTSSALRNSEFLRETITELLRSRRVVETCSASTVVNPLTVSINASGKKKRLILGLRYIYQFIWKQTFRLDDLKIMMQYVHKGDFMFLFDLKSDYHHLDIFSGHQQYLGFLFRFGSRIRYFPLQFYVLGSVRGLVYFLSFYDRL